MKAKPHAYVRRSKPIPGLALLLLGLTATIGCGGGSSNNGNVIALGPGSNNGMLNGTYAFTFSGNSASGFITAAGRFSADGNGNITNGLEDINTGTGSNQPITFSARYAIGADGRGAALLTPNFLSCSTWQFTMLNSSHALMTCFDTKDTASGAIDIENSTAFTTASLAGNYVFGLSGVGTGSNGSGALVTAGDLTLDGQGHVTGGEMDTNDNLTVNHDLALTGTYSIAGNGRGTARLTSAYATQNFAFYVVNAGDLKFVETDAQNATTPMVSGEVLTQAPGPYSFATLKGGYAFTMSGVDSTRVVALGTGGVVTADGLGGLNSGILDINDGGSIQLGTPFTSSYSFNSTGRFTASFLSFQIALYPAKNGTINLIDIDGNSVMGGAAKGQAGAPFSTGSTFGTFAVNFAGTLNPSSAPSEEDITGQLSANGGGGLSGTLDINNGQGGLFSGLALTTSSYAMNPNGYGGAAINTSLTNFNMQMYQIDANDALFLDIDGTRVLTGIMAKQQ